MTSLMMGLLLSLCIPFTSAHANSFTQTSSFSFALLAILTLLLPLSFYLFKRNRTLNYYLDQLRLQYASCDAILSEGYFFWDYETNKEMFSFGLQNTFGSDKLALFREFQPYMDTADFKELENMYEHLKNQKEGYIRSIQCHATINKHSKYFECIGERLINSQNQIVGVILWFRDITHVVQLQKHLYFENMQLKAENNRFSTLLNNLPFPIWLRNKMLDIVYCNATYHQMVDHVFDQLVSPESMELHKNSRGLARKAQQLEQQVQENYALIRDVDRHLFRFMEIPLQEEEQLLGFAIDITDKESIEKELQQHITAQSDLLESSASGMAVFGNDMRLCSYNQAYMRVWGLEEDWLESRPSYAQILEHLRERRKLPEQINFQTFKQNQLRLFSTVTATHNEFFHLPDGKTIRVIVIPHAFGGLLFVYEDMSDRLALERSYNMLIAVQRATLDSLHEGIAVVGSDGRLKLFNPVYARMWMHDFDMLRSEPHFSELIETARNLYPCSDEEWKNIKDNILSLLSKRQLVKERLERTDGKIIDRICVPLPDGATLFSYVEVTDSIFAERSLRERNQALEAADKIKTEFLANMSYELRTPLTSIIGLSEALSLELFGELNPKQKEYIHNVFVSSQQLASLINDTLDLASIEAGYMRLRLEWFDIFTILSSVVYLVRERLNNSRVEFIFDCTPDIGSMLGDERRIKQVIMKLLTNALDHTPAGGQIVLGVHDLPNGGLAMVMQDSGTGIPSDQQPYVFDKFFKLSTALEDLSSRRVGLGLSIVKQFVELHHGTVTLESTPGVGTKVACTFMREHPLLQQTYESNPLKIYTPS